MLEINSREKKCISNFGFCKFISMNFANAFKKIKNPFLKLLKMHLEIGNAFLTILEILGNAWKFLDHFQKLKMHLQNPWKCICKIHGTPVFFIL